MIRVFPRRTKWTPHDDLAFVGDPPLFRPQNPKLPVFVSVAFTWDMAEGKRLAASWARFYRRVLIDGPAYGNPGGPFVAGRFLKPGVTITSRGCPRRCQWCHVWRREERLRELVIKPGWIVQDDNLLACSERHVRAVFDMLSEQPRGAVFSGGLDARLFQDWHRELIEEIRVNELWFAADSLSAMPHLERAAKICRGISIEKLRCYVLIGFGGETIATAERRLHRVYELGFLAFAQLYRGLATRAWSPEWRALARKWSRPAAYRAAHSQLSTDH